VPKKIKNELLDVKDVAKVELFDIQNRTIEVTVNPSLLSQSGVMMADIASAFERQNKVVDAGAIETSTNRLRIEADGSFTSLEEIENLTVVSRKGEYFRLGEIAEIRESYSRPARNLMRIGNIPAVGIAISTVSDGNVVEMAELVSQQIDKLKADMPEGYELDIIYDQGYESAVANDGFVMNLIVSVLTVVAVLLFFIGFKNGFLIGSGLIFSIFGTLIYMQATGIALQRISLAAIIIAIGMLVDNAIVVYDAALINMQRGMRKRVAILNAVSSTAMPLLGATLIAVLTFLPVYLSPHITGEILSSLFIVIAVSLLLSWVLAITQNVFFVQEFVRRPRPEELKNELFTGRIYDFFRKALSFTIRKRYTVVGCMVVLLAVVGWGFRYIPQQFMPLLNKQYFSVDMWLPEGTRIEESEKQAAQLTEYLQTFDGVKKVSTYIGQTPPRYYLANAAYGPQPNYAQCLIEAETPEKSRELQEILYHKLPEKFQDALIRVNSFEINSIPQALIEARFCGDAPAVLDSLTNIAIGIMRKNPKVLNARNE
jgi:multidrug efflux pump subunit AcrB